MSEMQSILIHLPKEVKRKLKIEAAQNDQFLKVFIQDTLIGMVAGKRIKEIPIREAIVETVPEEKSTSPGPGGGSY